MIAPDRPVPAPKPGVAAVAALNPVVDLLAYSPEQQRSLEEEVARIATGRLGEYSPLEIKTSVVGYGRAEKHQVQLMVRSITGLGEAIESEDAADAIAVAICHATHSLSAMGSTIGLTTRAAR